MWFHFQLYVYDTEALRKFHRPGKSLDFVFFVFIYVDSCSALFIIKTICSIKHKNTLDNLLLYFHTRNLLRKCSEKSAQECSSAEIVCKQHYCKTEVEVVSVIVCEGQMGGNEVHSGGKTFGVVWQPGERFKAPDWRQYRVEDIKELKKVQDELAKKGLRNPWLR